MAKDVYYFSHDCNARNDTKIVDMMCDYGVEGYGVFWIVVELLREQPDYKFAIGRSTYRTISKETFKDFAYIEKFLKDCVEVYGLFVVDDNFFYSNSLLLRMGKFNDIKEKRSEASKKRWDAITKTDAKAMQMHSNCIPNAMQVHSKCNASAMQTDAKKRKENEIKEKDTYAQQAERLWLLYPNKKGKTDAIKKIPSLIEKYGYTKIEESINRYAVEVKGKNIQYTKHGSTFFSSGYIDYLEDNIQNVTDDGFEEYLWENKDTGEQEVRKRKKGV